MSLNLNKAIIAGRLTADPELKQTQTGISFTRFTVAVNRRQSKKDDGTKAEPVADFINVTAWRDRADFVCRYFHKGSAICVVGAINTSNYTDKQGNKQYRTEVSADEVTFVEGKSESGKAPAEMTASQAGYLPDAYKAQQPAKFEPMSGDGDLPF